MRSNQRRQITYSLASNHLLALLIAVMITLGEDKYANANIENGDWKYDPVKCCGRRKL